MPVFGGIFSDAVDFVSNAVDTVTAPVGDAFDAVIDTVPGARDVADAVDAVVTGPVRDFAHTGAGKTMLSALASSVTGGLAPLLGPQLATVAFALPGLASGDDFVTAWTQEFGKRVEETAAYLGDNYAGPYLKDQLAKASVYLDKLREAGIDPNSLAFQQFAKAADVTDLVAATVLDGARGYLHDLLNRFNPLTGNVVDQSGIDLASAVSQVSLHNLKIAAQYAAIDKTQTAPISAATYVRSSNSFVSRGGPSAAPVASASAVRAVAPTEVSGGASDKVALVALVAGTALLGGAVYFFVRK